MSQAPKDEQLPVEEQWRSRPQVRYLGDRIGLVCALCREANRTQGAHPFGPHSNDVGQRCRCYCRQ